MASPFILFYKFEVKGCWQATKAELEWGFSVHAFEPNPKAVAAKMQAWTTELSTNSAEFTKFFEFVFKFCRPSASAKAIQFEDIKEPMVVALGVYKKYAFVNYAKLVDFLGKKVKGVSHDLWSNIAKFLIQIRPDCSNYSEDDCWNVVLDDFVETCKL